MKREKKSAMSAGFAGLLFLAAAVPVTGETEEPRAVPGASAVNMRLLGHHDLAGRPSYQPTPHRYGARWILFAGHHAGEALNPLTGAIEANGFSVVDVSDPANPVLLHHEPPGGDETGGTQHVQVCDGRGLPGGDPEKVYLLRSVGQSGHEILDVTDPAAPAFVTTVVTTGTSTDGRRNTHKNWWDCATGIAYLVGSVDGWSVPRVLQAYDLSDPATPRHLRDFGLVGSQPGGAGDFSHLSGIHQPVAVGERIYLAYGPGAHGVIQILDRGKFMQGMPGAENPFEPTPANLLYPQIARLDMPEFWGAHTAKPLYGMEIRDYADSSEVRTRDMLVVVSESLEDDCREPRQAMFLLDITDEEKPFPVSSFQVPEEPGDFCHRGGRFGPHAPHDSFNGNFLNKIVLLSYFNAGVRAVDIRDPFRPVEVASYIPAPAATSDPYCRKVNGATECRKVIQTNNVNVGGRGYIYLLDRRGSGLHILELTGDARHIVYGPGEGG